MNILVIPDKFKDSLSAKEVINAITKGVKKHDKKHKIISVLASDGGDGFLEAVNKLFPNTQTIKTKTVNALGKPIVSNYLYDDQKKVAYIELAKSSGLAPLKLNQRNCKVTSTFGTGLQIKHAINKGVKKIFIGLGGSATNDGGTGIAHALGVQFLDINKKNIFPQGDSLIEISNIIIPKNIGNNIKFYAINDVSNKLLGKNGATYTYAKQKGATSNDLLELELGMTNLFKKTKKIFTHINDLPGFGAAGGTGFGLSAFFNAEFINGIDFILNKKNIDSVLITSHIDLIITGEGKIDDQTINDKFIKGLTEKIKYSNIPVVAICGVCKLKKYTTKDMGLHSIYSIKNEYISTEKSIKNAAKLIEDKVFEMLKSENFS